MDQCRAEQNKIHTTGWLGFLVLSSLLPSLAWARSPAVTGEGLIILQTARLYAPVARLMGTLVEIDLKTKWPKFQTTGWLDGSMQS